jgi:putative alpha-1,2-mannosidase
MISPGPFNEQYTNSGYSHAKKSLIGFNHTHLSGVGVGSYGLMDAFGVRTSQRMTSAQ